MLGKSGDRDTVEKNIKKCAYDENRQCKQECIAYTLVSSRHWNKPYCKRGRFYL